MDAANPTSPVSRSAARHGPTAHAVPRLEIERRDPRSLTLWQGHLRDLVCEARRLAGRWLAESTTEHSFVGFSPELAELADSGHAPVAAERIVATGAPGLLVLHRCRTPWETIADLGDLGDAMPPLDPARVLRSLHLHTDYRLARRRLLRRRNAALHLAQLLLPL